MGSGHTDRSRHLPHSAPDQTDSKSAVTRSTVSKSSVTSPSSKFRASGCFAPSPAPVRLALPRYTQAPSTRTHLKWTRGQIFSWSPPRTSVLDRSNAARNGRLGSSACSRRSSTPRRARVRNSASTGAKRPRAAPASLPGAGRCSIIIAFTLAVAIHTDSRAPAIFSWTTVR